MSELRIEHMVLGPMATNCYLVLNEETREIIIVDPADSPERIARSIDIWKAKPVAILLTHGHFDHIGAAEPLRNKYHIRGIQSPSGQNIRRIPSFQGGKGEG